MASPALDRALGALSRWGDAAPGWAASAPGRVNIIGEHVDYCGGLVLPMAINLRCVATAGRGAAGAGGGLRVRVRSENAGPAQHGVDERRTSGHHPGEHGAGDDGAEVELDLSAYPATTPRAAPGQWSAYAEGVVDGVLRAAAEVGRAHDARGALARLCLGVASDVPLGGGLASSASLETALATLLLRVIGLELDALAVARLCQRAEREFAGAPCGLMDQIASGLGREGHAMLLDCRSLAVEHVALPPDDDAAWLVVDSRVRHSIAGGEYAARRAAGERAAAALGVPSLRELAEQRPSAGALQARLAPLGSGEQRAAWHVVSEIDRVQRAALALRQTDLPVLGALMLESHSSLRDVLGVSCPELDTIVNTGARCPGVFGARLTGGGFGGCALVLLRPEAIDELSRRIEREVLARHGRDVVIRRVRADASARAEPIPIEEPAP